MTEYHNQVKRVLYIVLVINIILSFIKIFYGYSSNILSITTDGYDSLFDGVSNIISIIAIIFASKPPDKEHPYGHNKIETFAAVIISLLLFKIGYDVIITAIERFSGTTTPDVSIISFIIVAFTLIANIALTKYQNKKGHQLKSELLISDSEHTKSDTYGTFSVLIGLIFIKLGFTIVDPIISIAIALLIIKTGISILWGNLNILMDKTIIPPEEIEDVVMNIDGIKHVHNIRTRGNASKIFVDMHIVVDSHESVEIAYEKSHQCKDALCSKYNEIEDVIIYIEPPKGMDDEIILE